MACDGGLSARGAAATPQQRAVALLRTKLPGMILTSVSVSTFLRGDAAEAAAAVVAAIGRRYAPEVRGRAAWTRSAAE